MACALRGYFGDPSSHIKGGQGDPHPKWKSSRGDPVCVQYFAEERKEMKTHVCTTVQILKSCTVDTEWHTQ